MKKIVNIIGSSLFYLSIATPSFAQSDTINLCPPGTLGLCTKGFNSVGAVISAVIQFIVVAAIVIAFIFLVLGGIKWILSGGDKTKVESARNQIVAAIVGVVVTLLAFFILTVVLQLLGLGGVGTFVLPTIF